MPTVNNPNSSGGTSASLNIDNTQKTAYGNLVTETVNDMTTDSSQLSRLLRANGVFNRSDFSHDFDRFYIFPRNDPYKMLGTTREYVFVTKPDLHIFNNSDTGTLNPELSQDPFFVMLMDMGYNDTVLKSLEYSCAANMPFVPILSNYKTSNLELNSINAEDVETATNMYGTKLSYRSSSYRSDEYTDFSIEYKDNKYLDCYLWFKAYDVYEKRKAEGKISPTHEEYAIYKILSDQMTIFKIVVGEDGETIVFWSCMWGCYPKTVPRETFSDLPADGQLKFTVQWHCAFQDDMDPLILTHFNKLCAMQAGSTPIGMDLYDSEIHAVTGELARCPYIAGPVSTPLSPYKHYMLRWFS